MYKFNNNRKKVLKTVETKNKNVLYYTIRDLRVFDNWAVIYAQNLTYENNSQMYAIFSVLKNFLNGSIRQYRFLYEGLKYLDEDYKKINTAFHLIYGHPPDTIKNFINKYNIGYLIIEQFPLEIFYGYVNEFLNLNVNIIQIDAHNIVPVWIASNKSEYNAKTLRIKINKIKDEYLEEYPNLKKNKNNPIYISNDFERFFNYIYIDKTIPEIKDISIFQGGQINGMKRIDNFIKNKIHTYSLYKNYPHKHNESMISPWLHFGMISSQKIVVELNKLLKNKANMKTSLSKNIESYIEEIFIRKELSDNFCYYNKNYTSLSVCPQWAINSLAKQHTIKKNIYTVQELENAKTDSKEWNYCQQFTLDNGYLNSYLRMYWCKKILEWVNSPQKAIDIMIYLNDKYFLDGRDPNGYANVLWCIGGLHDRAFKERKIYGKVRYMSDKNIKKRLLNN